MDMLTSLASIAFTFGIYPAMYVSLSMTSIAFTWEIHCSAFVNINGINCHYLGDTLLCMCQHK